VSPPALRATSPPSGEEIGARSHQQSVSHQIPWHSLLTVPCHHQTLPLGRAPRHLPAKRGGHCFGSCNTHHGTIHLTSRPDPSSIFTAFLAVVPARASPPALRPPPAPNGAGTPVRGEEILSTSRPNPNSHFHSFSQSCLLERPLRRSAATSPPSGRRSFRTPDPTPTLALQLLAVVPNLDSPPALRATSPPRGEDIFFTSGPTPTLTILAASSPHPNSHRPVGLRAPPQTPPSQPSRERACSSVPSGATRHLPAKRGGDSCATPPAIIQPPDPWSLSPHSPVSSTDPSFRPFQTERPLRRFAPPPRQAGRTSFSPSSRPPAPPLLPLHSLLAVVPTRDSSLASSPPQLLLHTPF
jgi:hypothetical protein